MGIRRQLPAYSPITTKAMLGATARALGFGGDPRPRLRNLLVREYGAEAVLLCGSGTQALSFAIHEALGRVDAGRPVALPAFSCFDVATAAIAAGVRGLFYDIEPATLAPDQDSLNRVLRAGAGVVVVAPLFGVPVDWDALSALALSQGAVLIEDAAQCQGAQWKGRRVGSLGGIATLSFGRGKGWTGGRGGALLLSNPDAPPPNGFAPRQLLDEAQTLAGLIAQWALGRPDFYGLPHSIPALRLGETVYRAPEPPTLLTRAGAAMLLSTRHAAERESRVRKANARVLLAAAAGSASRPISIHRDATAGYLRFPLVVRGGVAGLGSVDRVMSLGVAPSYPEILPELRQLGWVHEGPESDWPGARELVRNLVTLPVHSRVSRAEIERIGRMISEA
jgi:dTDP-4-amino-4,6-dideoxygalactose transaminase